jgi:cytochrome c553
MLRGPQDSTPQLMKHEIKLIVAGALLAAGAAFVFAAPVAENWENHCAKCHGADGKGQTKVGKKLGLLDYTSAADQAKFTDAEAIKATAEGVTKDGKERMKSYKGELSEQEIRDLVAYVRKFKK